MASPRESHHGSDGPKKGSGKRGKTGSNDVSNRTRDTATPKPSVSSPLAEKSNPDNSQQSAKSGQAAGGAPGSQQDSDRSSTPTPKASAADGPPHRLTLGALKRLNELEGGSRSPSPPKPDPLKTHTGTQDDEEEEEDVEEIAREGGEGEEEPSNEELLELAKKLVTDACLTALGVPTEDVGKSVSNFTAALLLDQLERFEIEQWQKDLLKTLLTKLVEKARKKFFPEKELEEPPKEGRKAKGEIAGARSSAPAPREQRRDTGEGDNNEMSHRRRGKQREGEGLPYASSQDINDDLVVGGDEGGPPHSPRTHLPREPRGSRSHRDSEDLRSERHRLRDLAIEAEEGDAPSDPEEDQHRRRRRRRRHRNPYKYKTITKTTTTLRYVPRREVDAICRELDADIASHRRRMRTTSVSASDRIAFGVELFQPGAVDADKRMLRQMLRPIVELLKDIFRPAPKPRIYVVEEEREEEERRGGHRRRNSHSHSQSGSQRSRHGGHEVHETAYRYRKKSGSESMGGFLNKWL